MRKVLVIFFFFCLIGALTAFSQTSKGVVQGTVWQENGDPAIAATVYIKGSSKGVTCDVEGRYKIEVYEGDRLVFSLLGFGDAEVVVEKKMFGASQEIVLKEEKTALDEVVVVGYATEKKVNLTGSVVALGGQELEQRSTVNVLGSLQGMLPGVVVTQGSGQPGEEAFDLKVRGYTSVNGSNVLVLIDGIEGTLESVNPQDVQSISVLKDAASASIYGSKAAAGVILITTKSGSEGNVKVNYSGQVSAAFPGRHPSRLNSWEEYAILQVSTNKPISPEYIEWYKNPNLNSMITGDTAMAYYDNTDWVGVGLKKATTITQHSLSLSGGVKKFKYAVSLGYYNHQGFLKYGPDNNDRFNVRANIDIPINSHIKLVMNVSGVHSDKLESGFGSKNVLGYLYRTRTAQSIMFPDDDPLYTPNPYAGSLAGNPIDLMLNSGKLSTSTNDYTGKISLQIRDYLPGLRITLAAYRSARHRETNKDMRQVIWYTRGDNAYRYSTTKPSSVEKTRDSFITDKLQVNIQYIRSVSRKHNFNALVGYEWENFTLDRVYAYKGYMPGENNFSLNYGNAESATNSDLINKSAVASFFARFGYNFKERYLLEANVRVDGSSRLSPSNRWGTFPSVSAGWVISKEPFFRRVRAINFLKLRASFGQLGNAEALGYYDYINIYSYGKTVMGSSVQSMAWLPTLASENKTWEIVQEADLGLDLSMFRNRLTITADIYDKRNINMLANLVGVPSLIGVGLPSANVGTLRVWGWDLSVEWKHIVNKDFSYFIKANVSDSHNKLVKYNGANVINEGIVSLLEGYPLNTIWGYRTDGLWQVSPTSEEAFYQPGSALTDKGDVKYVNLDDDPHINGGEYTPEKSGDLVLLGSTDPRYTFGLQLGFQIKNWSISAFFQGVGKRNFLIDSDTLNPCSGSFYQAFDIHRDYWTEDNTSAFMPRPVFKGGAYNYKAADRWLQDASYIRLKNVQITYKIPLKKINELSLFLSGENLFEITRCWKQFDPEAPSLTKTDDYYAFYRSVCFGLNLKF